MHLRPENAVKCVLACCCLHNLLAERVVIEDPVHHDVVERDWHQEEQALLPMRYLGGNIAGNKIFKDQRNFLIDYYNDVGSVSWQKIDPQYLKKRKRLIQRPQLPDESNEDHTFLDDDYWKDCELNSLYLLLQCLGETHTK